MLKSAVELHGARAAISSGDGAVITYGEAFTLVKRAAKALLSRQIAHGDRIAIWAPNIAEWVVAALACHAVGAILVPISTRFRGAEAAHVLRSSGARFLFTVGKFLESDFVALLQEESAAPHVETAFLRGDARAGIVGWDEFLEAGAPVADSEFAARLEHVSPDDICDIMFTSGTTGAPKGVMSTHGQTLRAFDTWGSIAGLRAGDRYLVIPPFFHSFGYKAGWLASFIKGATVFPQTVFDIPAVLRRIERERITVMPGPPTLYQALLDHPDRAAFDLSSLRIAVTGAAIVPVDLVMRMKRELQFQTVLTAYGLTEATGVTTMCRAGDAIEVIANSSGRAIDGVEVRAVNAAGSDVPRGEPGELVVRGYTVMRGYYKNEEATRAAIDADGWLHTGDVGAIDEAGNVRITDRIKDMFIVGGFNAYPAEIERALLEHDAISEVAVIGVPDTRLGEVGKAFVVLRKSGAIEPSELIEWARARMANYKVPRSVQFVGQLPRNSSGKVLKFALRGSDSI